MCRENLFKAIRPVCAVCIAILIQTCNLLAVERLSVDPNRPHVILAGDKAMFLAGYYEAPDDDEPKFPCMDYFLDRNAQYRCNTFRLPFGQGNESGPDNPYCPYSAWNNNDCGQPNKAYYDNFLRPFCMHARDSGIYVVICLYMPDRDWPCDNKTDANRKKTYDKILEHTWDIKNVIIETNWEVSAHSNAFLYDAANYIQNHPTYPGVLAIVTDWHYGDRSHLGPNKINGRHRNWDRETSLAYWDSNRPTLWTERWFQWPAGSGGDNPMSAKEARVHLYRDALFCGSGIQFYYTRWNAPGHPDLPSSYLQECGHAVWLSTLLPLADMAPEERLDGFSADGYWFVAPGKCYAGYLENGGGVWVGLSDVSGDAHYFWFNPRNGRITGRGTVSGGGNRFFNAPDSNDWVLVIRSLAPPLPEKPTNPSAANQATDVNVTLN